MNWKKLKIGGLILVGLIILIPIVLYVASIDLSRSHKARVAALPIFSDIVDKGEYRIQANNLEFLIRTAGMQNDGPGIILLHGFPESSIMWQPLLDAAADKGYRAVAFDQRGYSPHARPSGVDDYHIDHLMADVLAIADKVGFDTFHLVGHDWGAAVGWKTTMDHPERIKTWTALSIPHNGVFFNAIQNNPEQKKRSGYMNKLRIPILPEFLFIINQKRVFEAVEGTWTPSQIAEYKALHREHGATTATLNWYRALDFDQIGNEKSLEKVITRPTLFIWGREDPVIAPEIIPLQKPYMDAPYTELGLQTGHSIMQMKEDSVLQAIFLHIDEI